MSNGKKVPFPEGLDAVVLDIIRQYDKPLESLVSHIKNRMLNTFLPGELVNFKISQNSVNIQGKIVAGEGLSIQQSQLSPLKIGVRILMDNAAAQLPSPSKTPKSVYSVKLLDRNEIITGVPALDLRRSANIPSKSVIRSFILHTGARYEGLDTGHWIVDESVLNNCYVSNPEKCSTPSKKLKCELGSKRKLTNSKVGKSKEKSESSKATSSLEPKKKCKKVKNAEKTKLKLSPVWAKVLKNASLEPEVVLVRFDGSQSQQQKCSGDHSKKNKVKLIMSASERKAEKFVKSPSPAKKMKQMTLLEMTKLSPPNKSVSFNPTTKTSLSGINAESVTDPVVFNSCASHKKLVVLKEAKKNFTHLTKTKTSSDYVRLSAKNGSTEQTKNNTANLPKSKKKPFILNKANRVFVISKTKGGGNKKGLTTNDITAAKTEKQKMLLVIDCGVNKKSSVQVVASASSKVNQQLLLPKIIPIPPPKLMETPVGFDNHWFGDAAMVIQFVCSFRGILHPDKSVTLSIDSLMEAVVSGKKGFPYYANLLVCLLHTLIQGMEPDEYQIIGVSLQDIPVNVYTVSEIARLCLLSKDSSLGISFSPVLPHVIQLLSSKEIYNLEPNLILSVLCALCTKLLDCPSVQHYVEQKRDEATKLRRERLKICTQRKNVLHHKNKNIKDAAIEQKENVAVSTIQENDPPDQETAKLNPEDFYGVISNSDTLEENLNSTIKKRKALAERVQTERQMAIKLAREREMKETEELKKQKVEEVLVSKLQAANELGLALRYMKPLGVDRHNSRYWLFLHSTPKFVIEKGWMMDIYDVACFSDESKSKLLSNKQENQWFTYKDEQEINKLLSSLSSDGQEKYLKCQLKKHLNVVVKSVSNANVSKDDPKDATTNDCIDLIVALREAISDVESRVVEGALGEVENRDVWYVNLAESNTCQDFAKCLKSLRESIWPRFICGVFTERSKDDGDDIDPWYRLLDSCTTISGMHVLLHVLETCINWERSSMNQRCKACRRMKAKDESRLISCDECNMGYHLSCLRPPLNKIPVEEWFCTSCKASREASLRASKTAESEDEDTSGNSGEEAEDSEDNNSEESEDSGASDMLEEMAKMPCVECNKRGNNSVVCFKCYRCFHKTCHNPPLKNSPRGHWICYRCKSGASRGSRKSRRSSSHRNNSRSLSFDCRSRSSVVRNRRSVKDLMGNQQSPRSSLSHRFELRRKCRKSN